MIAKKKYRALCEDESTIPIFSQAWWLDALAGDQWEVVLVEQGGAIQASMPYVVRRHLGVKILTQPVLTQNLGPWIRPGAGKYARQLAREKDLMHALIDQLPDYGYFRQQWHHNIGNWLPFYWRGFQQTTRYTYRLAHLDEPEELWAGLQDNIRREIRKASDRFGVTVDPEGDLEDFLQLNELVFKRQKIALPYDNSLVRRLDTTAAERGQRRIFIAMDSQGRKHAGLYLVWDQESAYYLMGGGDPELRKSGATSLCMWAAIQFAAEVTNAFDFEGSMIEPVERFFRAFGAQQRPYFLISHAPSRFWRLAMFGRDFLR